MSERMRSKRERESMTERERERERERGNSDTNEYLHPTATYEFVAAMSFPIPHP